jgi:UDP-N-acetylglucosamine 4-epimerase
MKILVTGGAGFIGSNLVEELLKDQRVALIKVIDDLSNGYYENIKPFIGNPKFEFIEDSICNYESLLVHTKDIDLISHQAALGSVPRSISNPLLTNEVNIGGTLNVLFAAVQNNVKRVILACSSSTYGDSIELPKREDRIGKPLSPYAVSKYAIELYADVFQKNYGLDFIGLRYFNVFGPNQNPNNPYAAVIPLFCKAFIENTPPQIFGDGKTSRDFTFVENVVNANILALFTERKDALNQIYNLACGEQTTLIEMVEYLTEISGKSLPAIFQDHRKGDVKHSLANISKIKTLLSYEPKIYFREGLEIAYNWYQNQPKNY